MSKGTIPSIAFNRMRNDVHRLIGLEYIPPGLREQTRMLMPILDMLEGKFTAAYYAHTQAPSKLTDRQVAKLNAARENAVRKAQLAVIEKRPLSANPFPAGELRDEWRKGWYFFTNGAPGGVQGFYSYVPPDDD
jgi:hypothetical protein